jgi:CDP-diacylglycerol---serine O-phosphatidyltransferase
MKKRIPNTLTLFNLLSGFIAILFLMTGHVKTTVYFVLIATFFDFLDGFTARLLHAYSDLGKQLDSLADLVSFGVVPALVMFHELMVSTGSPFPGGFPNNILLLTPVAIVAGAGYRLGRFTTQESGSKVFNGLPTPAMALFMISIPMVRTGGYFGGVVSWLNQPYVLALLALLFGWLMVSHLPMFSLKFTHYRFKGNEITYIFVFISLILLVLFFISGLFFIIILYIFIALGIYIVSGPKS